MFFLPQHEETTAAKDLADLEGLTEMFELEPDDTLYGTCKCDRGLFFVEEGMLVRFA